MIWTMAITEMTKEVRMIVATTQAILIQIADPSSLRMKDGEHVRSDA